MLDDCWKTEHAAHVHTMFIVQIETPRKIGLEDAHPIWHPGHEDLKFYLFEASDIAPIDAVL